MSNRIRCVGNAYLIVPGNYGIGSFGKVAYDFVVFLIRTKQTY